MELVAKKVDAKSYTEAIEGVERTAIELKGQRCRRLSTLVHQGTVGLLRGMAEEGGIALGFVAFLTQADRFL